VSEGAKTQLLACAVFRESILPDTRKTHGDSFDGILLPSIADHTIAWLVIDIVVDFQFTELLVFDCSILSLDTLICAFLARDHLPPVARRFFHGIVAHIDHFVIC
jgi:hypothetical protein